MSEYLEERMRWHDLARQRGEGFAIDACSDDLVKLRQYGRQLVATARLVEKSLRERDGAHLDLAGALADAIFGYGLTTRACATCSGTGQVHRDGYADLRTCPVCHGRGSKRAVQGREERRRE